MKENTKSRKTTKEDETKKKTVKRTVKKEAPREEIEIINKSVDFNLLEVVIIILITGIVVSIASGLIVYNNYDRLNVKQNNNRDELSEFIDSYNHILDSYVEEVDKKELIEAAIEGMYNHLNDGYSMYLDVDNTNDLEEQLSGEYTGIGVEIRTEVKDNGKNVTIINRVFDNSPAQRAGLKAEDIILKIDGEDVIDASNMADTIKKGNKESYEITYKRNGKEHTITLVRERVYINSVTSKTYDNVGYIKLETFSATTETQVRNAINGFDSNITSLVIDLRDNTGGYLSAAEDVSELFIDKGNVIYQLKDKNGKITKHFAQTNAIRKFDKIAVLVNSSSASASEIVAIALKEDLNAIVVGTTSYGKGTVQETKVLSSGAMVKYTTSYWLSPKGNSINKEGIKPDIEEEKEGKQIDAAVKAVK
jgi:carboxyl-terminal processing protease